MEIWSEILTILENLSWKCVRQGGFVTLRASSMWKLLKFE
jgi:hypothetical protein